jgi:hypothetical protein
MGALKREKTYSTDGKKTGRKIQMKKTKAHDSFERALMVIAQPYAEKSLLQPSYCHPAACSREPGMECFIKSYYVSNLSYG